MLIYYKLSGVNAVVALIFNLVILLGLMAYIGATMTLPGIAGFVLTMGIGVDSNVLIFERIKEELAAQRGVRASINAGFSRVFLTLLDTHVASLISAAFLFQFGTGPIRGFAMTLVIGLHFQPVHVHVRVEDAVRSRARPPPDRGAEHLELNHADLQDSQFRFRPLAVARDRALVGHHPCRPRRHLAEGPAARRRVLRRHDRHRAVRSAAAEPSVIRAALDRCDAGRRAERHHPALRRCIGASVHDSRARRRRGGGRGPEQDSRRSRRRAEDGRTSGTSSPSGTEIVGPAVGEHLRRQGILATVLALGGILLYIAFRFQFSFAVGAVVATIHDLLVTFAFLAFFRYDLSLNVIAAILTVTGYSTNDTIVIFDRVRENIRGMRRDNLYDIVNRSVNQTLGRTVITAGTALLSAAGAVPLRR